MAEIDGLRWSGGDVSEEWDIEVVDVPEASGDGRDELPRRTRSVGSEGDPENPGDLEALEGERKGSPSSGATSVHGRFEGEPLGEALLGIG